MDAHVSKLDLVKSFDHVNWTFLYLILLQVGLTLDLVIWIMDCVSTVNYEVLVNGSPTCLFNASRGIRQGCPLSPLIFLLVIEGLSILIQKSKRLGISQGISLSPVLAITHLIFVDDSILFDKST